MLITQDLCYHPLRSVLSVIIFALPAVKIQLVPSGFWGAMLHPW